MWLTRLAINRRVTIAMAIFAIMVLGLVGLSRMPWEMNPDVEIPSVSIILPYPGAGPEEIEQRVLRPLEDEVSVINGVDEVDATAYENLGVCVVRFNYEIDVDVAAADVRDALARARASFPSDVEDPSVYKIDIGALPVLTVGISGDREPRDLRKLVEDVVRPRLGQINGVASVTISGGQEREIQVLAHKDRLDAVGLSIAQLASLLRSESIDVPSGNIKEGARDYAIRVIGQFEDLQEIRDLEIAVPNGGLVRLSSLAEVYDTVVEPDEYARIDGQPTVRVAVIKQSDANTVQVVRQARKVLTELVGDLEGEQGAGELPADIRVVVADDDSERVIEAILDVRDAIVFGALLAALVVFLTLHNFRGTIIVALAIPTAIISAFLPVSIGFGFTLNQMVLLALSLAVGTLVDDSIVIIENIDRHRNRGEPPKVAALNGRSEIASAAVAVTMVDVVVYVPVALMGGVVGQVFFSFGITAATVVSFSLLMSFTLTPMLASWWYQRVDPGAPSGRGLWAAFFNLTEAIYGRFEIFYGALLRRAVSHPYITVAVAYAAMILVLGAVRLPFEFFPVTDEGEVSITLETGVGTRLEETDSLVREIERRLLDESRYPAIEHVISVVGSQGSGLFGAGSVGGQYAQMQITMKRLRERRKAGLDSDQELAARLRKDLADLPGVIIKVTAGGGLRPGGADLQLNILCEDSEQLARASTDLMHRVAKIPGLRYVDLSAKPGRPEVHARIDRWRAADLGMSVAQIGAVVRTAFEGDNSTKFREEGDEYDIRLQLIDFDRKSVSDVENLFIGLTKDHQPLRLRDVADVYLSTGPSRIERYNRQRKVTLSASLDQEILRSGPAQQAVDAVVKEWKEPGVDVAWTGSLKMQGESFGFMGQALMLAVILVYVVMAMLYNSLLQPLNVMLNLPIALVGALIALKLTGNVISIVAMIGIIMLMGLVSKNAILLIDFTNTLRARGKSRFEALTEAGSTRMRPILMTTASTVLGILPTALARNEGSEWRSPMAWAVIGGLLLSTMLSLLVVPASYCIWDQVEIFSGRFARGLGSLMANFRNGRRGDGGKGEPPESPGPPALPEPPDEPELPTVDGPPEPPAPPARPTVPARGSRPAVRKSRKAGDKHFR